MNAPHASSRDGAALSTRLSRLARLSPEDMEALRGAEADQRHSPPRRDLIAEDQPIREQLAVLSGWACRQRILRDGRRQILSFLLPGDLIGVCRQSAPVSATGISTVTKVVTCPAPPTGASKPLADAYARSAALEERHFLAQITRLGRMNAIERLADWLLETGERLALAGVATRERFPLPITQELLADALGLTSVHVNRTLQAMRRDGLLQLQAGVITLADRARLEKFVGYEPPRVSADPKGEDCGIHRSLISG